MTFSPCIDWEQAVDGVVPGCLASSWLGAGKEGGLGCCRSLEPWVYNNQSSEGIGIFGFEIMMKYFTVCRRSWIFFFPLMSVELCT